MARKKKRTNEVDNVRFYVEGVAKNLVEKLYGPQGPAWGTKLSEIEALCLDIRDMLCDEILEVALQRQAATHEQQTKEEFRCCPSCQRPLDWDQKETQERIVQTDAGTAAWSEPEGHCRRCRRSFFPSVPKPGD